MMDEIEMTEVVIEDMEGIGKNVDPTVEETTLVEMMIVIGPFHILYHHLCHFYFVHHENNQKV
jgi:hypothetical protein